MAPSVFSRALVLLCAVALSAAPPAGSTAPESQALPRHVLNNDGLVVLATAGLSDALLADLIRHKRTQFNTSADALAALARQGLSEKVIRAVVEKQDGVELRKPEWVLSQAPAPPFHVAEGEVVLMPPPAGQKAESKKKSGADAGRWYKLSQR